MQKKFLFWTPRILAMLAILFAMIFSLDCFDMEASKVLLCFLMHNIPAFILILVLVVAWKWELIGGILFVIAFFTGAIFFDGFGENWGALIIMIPFLLTGVMFIVYYYLYLRKI